MPSALIGLSAEKGSTLHSQRESLNLCHAMALAQDWLCHICYWAEQTAGIP